MNQSDEILSRYLLTVQQDLFPMIEEEFDELSDRQLRLIAILEVLRIEESCNHNRGIFAVGRPRKDRTALARSFVAKAIYQIPTTELLIEHLKADRLLRRICGFAGHKNVPSASLFSRAFKEFAQYKLPEKVHEAFLKRHFSNHVFGHVARDSSALAAREKIERYEKEAAAKVVPTTPKKRGRPRKAEKADAELAAAKEARKSVLEQQLTMSAAELLAAIPRACDKGTKVDSRGYKVSWKGYKIHLDVADGQIPIFGFVSSASVHDSQAAIPLAKVSSQRVTYLYELMDSAYDAGLIRYHSYISDHVALIDHNKRRGEKREFAPHEAQRYKGRTMVERVFGRLKDEFGMLNIQVKKHLKVQCHVMFSIISLAADQLLRFLRPESVT
jgi:hypothetical protein